jgi:hypothetical protein
MLIFKTFMGFYRSCASHYLGRRLRVLLLAWTIVSGFRDFVHDSCLDFRLDWKLDWS